MIIQILLPLLAMLVPELVALAEKSIVGSGQGPQKRQWVIDTINAILVPLQAILPDWAKSQEGALIEFIDFLIDEALDKLKVG